MSVYFYRHKPLRVTISRTFQDFLGNWFASRKDSIRYEYILYYCNFGNNVAGWPDWANFSLLGDCFIWVVSWKWLKEPKDLGYFSTVKLLNLTKMGSATFWATFSQTHLVTLVVMNISLWNTRFVPTYIHRCLCQLSCWISGPMLQNCGRSKCHIGLSVMHKCICNHYLTHYVNVKWINK
jgi:hypothetical protein